MKNKIFYGEVVLFLILSVIFYVKVSEKNNQIEKVNVTQDRLYLDKEKYKLKESVIITFESQKKVYAKDNFKIFKFTYHKWIEIKAKSCNFLNSKNCLKENVCKMIGNKKQEVWDQTEIKNGKFISVGSGRYKIVFTYYNDENCTNKTVIEKEFYIS